MSQIAANHHDENPQAAQANYPAPSSTALSDKAWAKRLAKIASDARMHPDNITVTPSTIAKISRPMLVVGLVMLLVTGVAAFSISIEHAIAGLEVGIFTALAISLGSLFWVMVFHALNAGWSITLRRQFENIASLVWIPWVCLLIIAIAEVAFGGILLDWLNPEVQSESYLLKKKAAYLNAPFFLIRVLCYGIVWIGLSRMLLGWSKKMDETGDRSYGRKLRFFASMGIPFFALSTAFCAFDFLMALDFRFFSTMWGVYYFASCALGSVSAIAMIAALLRSAGKLQGLVTEEHSHDLGKLIFGFTVFWAYITFSQYFLIWYSNIPEETAWFVVRNAEGWSWLFVTLCIGHFIFPFLILIQRGTKRNPKLLALFGAFMIAMVAFDMAWIILPMVSIGSDSQTAAVPGAVTHIAAILGVLMIFGWFACKKMTQSALIPTKDPLLHEAMKHKNYV